MTAIYEMIKNDDNGNLFFLHDDDDDDNDNDNDDDDDEDDETESRAI